MAKIYTTEITSEQITSDNPIHQRLFKAYVIAQEYVKGDVLEIGCGEGRGIELMSREARSYSAVDKIKPAIDKLQKKHPQARFISMNIPPLSGLPNGAFDLVISFQVIEHIQNDFLFLQEINRVLKPGGTALLTTPNKKLSLTRNPWHIREYTAIELNQLAQKIFTQTVMKGITGNHKVMSYYEENKKSVKRFSRWDFFNLQYKIPASLLRLPYEILNRWNRNQLQSAKNDLVKSIQHEDYMLTDDASNALDLFLILKKMPCDYRGK